MSRTFFVILFCIFCIAGFSQRKTENIIIITLDGLRWQEVFKGVDEALMNDSNFNRGIKEMKEKFWADTEEQRRMKLFPFIWNTIATQGQVYGNRKYNNNVDNANPHWFSYPGYNEIFTGYPDTSINSNDKIYNKHENVLEFINKQKGYKGKVAAFATWDAFPYILNEPRSGVYVNADVDTMNFTSPTLCMLNEMQFLSTKPIGVRPDVITYFAAKEYFKEYKPKVLYIAFDETDDFAHAGMYDQYIGSAHAEDAMIADLWKLVQSMPQYKDKTTMLITVDHGRGDLKKSDWQHHGARIREAHEIWMAAIGPDTAPLGEVKTGMQLYQAQAAATMSALLGFEFKTDHPVQPAIETIFHK